MAGKSDIINHVADSVDGITKKQAGEMVDALVEAVTDHLANGDRVSLPGFGSFSISHRKARQGRNPQTGATIRIKASNNVRFKAGKDLKDAVN